MNNPTLENLVKCAICLDNYTDPRCLPCSHTYCYQCIDKLCEDGIGQCPMRDNTIFFRHTIDKLPVNRIAKDLVECINKSSSSSLEIQCDHCQQIQSEFFCQTCSKHFCTICIKIEHDINQFKTHEINIIFNNNNSNNFCLEHIEEKQKYWCLNCQELVCSDCLLFKHKSHLFVTLKEIYFKIKNEFNSTKQEFIQMKINLEKFQEKTNETYRNHYQIHKKIINHIEQTFSHLQTILEQRKKFLIKIVIEKDSQQQKILREHKNNIEEQFKTIFIRQLFIEQLLNTDQHFKVIQMKNDFNCYNQLIHQQYQQIMQSFIYDFQYFNIDQDLVSIEKQLKDFGQISTQTFLTNQNHSYPLIKLSDSQQEEQCQELNGNYAYGYRFHLNKPFKINSIYVKINLFKSNLIIYLLNHDDTIIEKIIYENKDGNNNSLLKWINIPINNLIKHNSYLFIWTKSNENLIPIISYKESNQNLRQINDKISVRSRRAQLIQSNLNVIYDAFDDQQETKIIPSIEILLDIEND